MGTSLLKPISPLKSLTTLRIIHAGYSDDRLKNSPGSSIQPRMAWALTGRLARMAKLVLLTAIDRQKARPFGAESL